MTRQTTILNRRLTPTTSPLSTGLLQRKCACGKRTIAGGECEECQKKRSPLQRRSVSQAEPSGVSPIVHEVLRSPGQSLDSDTRTFMESRTKHRGKLYLNQCWMQAGEEAGVPRTASPDEAIPSAEHSASVRLGGQCCRYRRLYMAAEEYRPVTVGGERAIVKYAKVAFEMERGANPQECVLVNWNQGCKYEIDDRGQVLFEMAVHHLGGVHDWCFPTWSVDSIDPDPVFWSDRGSTRWNYGRESPNTYYMEDRPGACSHPEVHAVQFKTCIYCQNDVPTTTDTSGSNIGPPLACVEWQDSTRWRDPNTAEHPSLPDPRCTTC